MLIVTLSNECLCSLYTAIFALGMSCRVHNFRYHMIIIVPLPLRQTSGFSLPYTYTPSTVGNVDYVEYQTPS